MLSDTDRAYAAGIIDGEGSLMILAQNRQNKRPTHSPTISVSSTDEGIIRWLHETFGGSVYDRPQPVAHHKHQLGWSVSTYDALRVVREIHPYLRIKKRQADLLLEMEPLLGLRPYNERDEIVAKRETLRQRMQELNKRGRVDA